MELYLAGDLAGAEARLRNVLRTAPLLPEAHHHLAVVLHARAQDAEAVALLERALELNPHLTGARERLALYRSARAEASDSGSPRQ